MAKTPGSATSSRTLVLIMAGVVVSFILATAATQFRENRIDGRVVDLVENALPSVQKASEIQSSLRDVIVHVQQISNAPLHERARLRELIVDDEKDIEAALHSYLGLIWFPGERELANDLRAQKPKFSEALYDYLDSVMKNGTVDTTIHNNFESQGLSLDHALQRLIEFDVAQGERLGREISRIRDQSLYFAFGLDLVSVALAFLATILTLRLKRVWIGELEEKTKELEIFAGRVAHDLKNPLGAILMSSELAGRDTDDPKARELFDRIASIGHRMTAMIDGLLGFACSGAIPEDGAKARVVDSLDSSVDTVRLEAEKAQVNVKVDSYGENLAVACSEGVLSSIVSNLLRNALKYIVDGSNPKKQISVRVKDQPRSVRIEVEDNGPGIAPDKLNLIFEPYFRANRKQDGIGLGLATVKRLVESHGGRLGVFSATNKGSTFWFELPKPV